MLASVCVIAERFDGNFSTAGDLGEMKPMALERGVLMVSCTSESLVPGDVGLRMLGRP